MSLNVFALSCDCEVRVYSPLTGSHQFPPNPLKTYELEEYSSYSVKHQKECRENCQKKFEEDMPGERMNALLLTYAQSLINEKVVGYNCTGLTTLKFPVRLKARLGDMGLGNIVDVIHVVTREELCF
jgi:hypothetical protein